MPQDRLDDSAADIAADIEHVRHDVAGMTIYGALTTILRARRAAGAGQGDIAVLRQSSPQRHAVAQRPAAISRAHRRRRLTPMGRKPDDESGQHGRPDHAALLTESARPHPRCDWLRRRRASHGRIVHANGSSRTISRRAGQNGRTSVPNWSIRCCRSRKRRSASSTLLTAALRGLARWQVTDSSTKALETNESGNWRTTTSRTT